MKGYWDHTRKHYPEKASALGFKDDVADDLVKAMWFIAYF